MHAAHVYDWFKSPLHIHVLQFILFYYINVLAKSILFVLNWASNKLLCKRNPANSLQKSVRGDLQ